MSKQLRIILLHADILLIRLVMALNSLIWSMMLFWPGDTFDRPIYSIMLGVAPEISWASLFLIHGVFALYTINKNYCARAGIIMEALLGTILWTGSTLMLILNIYPPPAAIAPSVIITFMSWWILVRYPKSQR